MSHMDSTARSCHCLHRSLIGAIVARWRSASAPPPGCGSIRRASTAAGCPTPSTTIWRSTRRSIRRWSTTGKRRRFPVGWRRSGPWPSAPRTGSSWPATRPFAVFAPDGKKLKDIALEQEPYCLAVGNAGHASPGRHLRGHEGSRRGLRRRRQAPGRLGPARQAGRAHFDRRWPRRTCSWPTPARWSSGTTIPAGKAARPDRQARPVAGIPGFIVPSPYFDVAVAPDGLLRVVNPGAHRVEAYTFDGHLELSWGKRGMGIGDFCGCCNPSNIAILPDGRVVTAEKGIPRVKVYSASGSSSAWWPGRKCWRPTSRPPSKPATSSRLHPVDLAVDSRARILVLDPTAKLRADFRTQISRNTRKTPRDCGPGASDCGVSTMNDNQQKLGRRAFLGDALRVAGALGIGGGAAALAARKGRSGQAGLAARSRPSASPAATAPRTACWTSRPSSASTASPCAATATCAPATSGRRPSR